MIALVEVQKSKGKNLATLGGVRDDDDHDSNSNSNSNNKQRQQQQQQQQQQHQQQEQRPFFTRIGGSPLIRINSLSSPYPFWLK